MDQATNAKACDILIWPAVNIALNKSISNELDINFHVIASQFSDQCDVINNRLLRRQQYVNCAS